MRPYPAADIAPALYPKYICIQQSLKIRPKPFNFRITVTSSAVCDSFAFFVLLTAYQPDTALVKSRRSIKKV